MSACANCRRADAAIVLDLNADYNDDVPDGFDPLPPYPVCGRCVCPVCGQNVVGYDTDGDDGRGALNCPACWTEFTDADDGTLVPVRQG